MPGAQSVVAYLDPKMLLWLVHNWAATKEAVCADIEWKFLITVLHHPSIQDCLER